MINHDASVSTQNNQQILYSNLNIHSNCFENMLIVKKSINGKADRRLNPCEKKNNINK
jgi:hypothetical protein